MTEHKITLPLSDGTNFILTLKTDLDSRAVQDGVTLLNCATELRRSLLALVQEMAPLALISQSVAYKEAREVLIVLGDLQP